MPPLCVTPPAVSPPHTIILVPVLTAQWKLRAAGPVGIALLEKPAVGSKMPPSATRPADPSPPNRTNRVASATQTAVWLCLGEGGVPPIAAQVPPEKIAPLPRNGEGPDCSPPQTTTAVADAADAWRVRG